MPRHEYPLEVSGPKRVKIEWRGIFKNIEVSLDGRVLGRFSDAKALKIGQQFDLPDGLGVLHVQFVAQFAGSELRMVRNGVPLPGSPSDPATRVKTAAIIAYVVGGMSIGVGLIAMATGSELLDSRGFGVGTVVEGGVFIGLGLAVHKLHSRIALGTAIVIVVLEVILGLFAGITAGQPTPPIGGIFIKVMFAVIMARAFGALGTLNAKEQAEPVHTGVGEGGAKDDPFATPRE